MKRNGLMFSLITLISTFVVLTTSVFAWMTINNPTSADGLGGSTISLSTIDSVTCYQVNNESGNLSKGNMQSQDGITMNSYNNIEGNETKILVEVKVTINNNLNHRLSLASPTKTIGFGNFDDTNNEVESYLSNVISISEYTLDSNGNIVITSTKTLTSNSSVVTSVELESNINGEATFTYSYILDYDPTSIDNLYNSLLLESTHKDKANISTKISFINDIIFRLEVI